MRKFIVLLALASLLPILASSQEGRPPSPVELPQGDAKSKIGIKSVAGPPALPDPDYVKRAAFERFAGVNRKEVEAFLKEYYVEQMIELKELSLRRPDEAVEVLTSRIHDSMKLMELRTENKEKFKKVIQQMRLERLSRRLADDVKSETLDSASKKAKLEELEKTLDEAFEVKQDLMKESLKGIEDKLSELKSLIEKRQHNQKSIVQRRLSDLTGERSDLEW